VGRRERGVGRGRSNQSNIGTLKVYPRNQHAMVGGVKKGGQRGLGWVRNEVLGCKAGVISGIVG